MHRKQKIYFQTYVQGQDYVYFFYNSENYLGTWLFMIACSRNNDTTLHGNRPTCSTDSSAMQNYPKKISNCLRCRYYSLGKKKTVILLLRYDLHQKILFVSSTRYDTNTILYHYSSLFSPVKCQTITLYSSFSELSTFVLRLDEYDPMSHMYVTLMWELLLPHFAYMRLVSKYCDSNLLF